VIGPTSRYVDVGITSVQAIRNGVPVELRFVNRRFIPPPAANLTIISYTVKQGDRVDNIAARFLGDPTQFWRIADVNVVLRPSELTDTLGNTIEIALLLGAGRLG
jgi:hypothetical protein